MRRGAAGPTGPTGTGATGASGPTGPTGAAGANVFHMVTSAPTSVDATITASCAPGEVVTGGGYTGSATRDHQLGADGARRRLERHRRL